MFPVVNHRTLSTSQTLLRYIVLIFDFEAPFMSRFVVYSSFALQILFNFFPSFFPFSLTFFANNDISFIKWYSCSYLSQCFFCFHFQWHLFFPAFISLCYPCPFVCYCIHVACHSSFCFLINLSETFQSSPTIFSFLLEYNLSSLACLPWNPCLRNA